MNAVELLELNNQNESVYRILFMLTRYSNESENGLSMIGRTNSLAVRQEIEELLGKSCSDRTSKSKIGKEIEELVIDMSIAYNKAFKDNENEKQVTADEYIELLQSLKEKTCQTKFNEDMAFGEIADKLASDADKLRSRIDRELKQINATNTFGGENAADIQYFKDKTEKIMHSLEISVYAAKTKLPKESQKF